MMMNDARSSVTPSIATELKFIEVRRERIIEAQAKSKKFSTPDSKVLKACPCLVEIEF